LPVDFDGDQWTFFKPSHDDLWSLYGLDVHELNVWKPLLHCAEEQIRSGRIVLSEVDAFFLPDTAGTDYKTQHTKTTIGMQDLDAERGVLRYFHNSGYHELEGADFRGLFRVDAPPDPAYMPFFAEFVRVDRRRKLDAAELTRKSLAVLGKHLEHLPRENPIARFSARFGEDLSWMQREGLAAYHAWAFATLRQLGAAFELGAFYMRWLSAHGQDGLTDTAAAFDAISNCAKALILKTARAVNTKKPFDAGPMLAEASRAWDAGTRTLVERYGK
jgi:hypothetical protein